MYTVKLYNNTGYNVENIPDSAALLGTPSIEKTAVDTVQNYVMTSVRISAVFDDVKNADYCQIGDFYYFIAGVNMTSRDVAVLNLIPDYITSYGLTNLNFLDGITVRHHVDDDGFGKYAEDDPLLYCNEPLELVNGDMLFNADDTDVTIAMSTVDLYTMGTQGFSFNGTPYDDGSGNVVVVPHLEPIMTSTIFGMGTPTEYTQGAYRGFQIAGQQAFIVNGDQTTELAVREGLQYVRDIAAESAVTAQYNIPANYITINGGPFSSNTTRVITDIIGKDSMDGVGLTSPTGLKWQFATVKNNRVLYGSYCPYGIITASGSRLEANPEIIYGTSEQSEGPKVLMRVDPRPDGCPYFRFAVYYGNSAIGYTQGTNPELLINNVLFWEKAIAGQKWYQVPLVYTSLSGAYQETKLYNAAQEVLQGNREDTLMARRMNNLSAIYNLGKTYASGFGDVTRLVSTPTAVSAEDAQWNTAQRPRIVLGSHDYTGMLGQINGIVSSRAAQRIQDREYYNELGRNRWEHAMNNALVVPDIMFPYSGGTLRDMIGNGVFMYRYKPSQKDIELQDKILTMYGYRVTDKLDISHFYNRQYFNYVQANNITIGSHIPQWWKAGIVAQLAAGVRVWHVTPDETHYDNNPIVTNP